MFCRNLPTSSYFLLRRRAPVCITLWSLPCHSLVPLIRGSRGMLGNAGKKRESCMVRIPPPLGCSVVAENECSSFSLNLECLCLQRHFFALSFLHPTFCSRWMSCCRPTFEANVQVDLAKVRGYSTGTIQKNLGEWGQWNYSFRSVLIRLQWTMWSSWAKSSQRSCLSRWLSYLWCWSTTSCLLLVPGWFRYILPCSRLWSYFLLVSQYSNHTDRHLTGPCLINFTF